MSWPGKEWTVLDKAREAWTATDVAIAAGLEDPVMHVARKREQQASTRRPMQGTGLTTLRVCQAIAHALAGGIVRIETEYAYHARDRLLEVAQCAGIGARVDPSDSRCVRVEPGLVRVGPAHELGRRAQGLENPPRVTRAGRAPRGL